MRKLLLLATASLFLAFGAIGAGAAPLNGQAVYAAVNRQTSSADSNAPLIEGRSAFTQDGSEQALAGAAIQVLLVGAAAFVLALGAVGFKSLWMRERGAFAPFDVIDQPPYRLSNEPLNASCDGSNGR